MRGGDGRAVTAGAPAAPLQPLPSSRAHTKTDLAISSLGVFFIVQLLNCETCKQSAGVSGAASEQRDPAPVWLKAEEKKCKCEVL